jgi:hypothetical protein
MIIVEDFCPTGLFDVESQLVCVEIMNSSVEIKYWPDSSDADLDQFE